MQFLVQDFQGFLGPWSPRNRQFGVDEHRGRRKTIDQGPSSLSKALNLFQQEEKMILLLGKQTPQCCACLVWTWLTQQLSPHPTPPCPWFPHITIHNNNLKYFIWIFYIWLYFNSSPERTLVVIIKEYPETRWSGGGLSITCILLESKHQMQVEAFRPVEDV